MSGDSKSSSSSMEITLNDMRETMEHTTDLTEEYFLSGVSGEPKMCPRVGDQYQAMIPDMIEGNKCSKPNADEVSKAVDCLLPALSIPLMWVPNKARDEENLKYIRGQTDPYAEENKVVINSENGCTSTAQTKNVNIMELNAASVKGSQMLGKEEKNLYPLPGTPDEPWSDFELDSFLLALYIFGKDLYLVKKFVETKKMNDVISFYYGPFYKCSKYQRWAKCLRSRSRKSIHGQRMFTGGRQQELFSRLNRHISEETSNKLTEASKTFKEDKMLFEDYVFTLKDLVGTKLFIEVVAVGKGKQDLTGIAAEPLKLNRSVSVRVETQQDKGLSSLSCKEITEQLTSSRLSKTKSNDLFWEAVWPRLLAGGWHSEQPKDQHHLVFLLPDVKKFKRNKLVKGQHYFDSVSDILNKVASDPQILELEDEKEKNTGHEVNHLEEDETDLPKRKQNGTYLNLCNSDRSKNEMEFMIVDTSKHRGSKAKLMQTLPVNHADVSSSSSACSGWDSSSEKSDGEVEDTNPTKSSKYGFDRESSVGIYSKKQKIDNSNIKRRNSKKHRLEGKLKSGKSMYLSTQKRRQANAVSFDGSSDVAEKRIDRPIILCLPNPYKAIDSKQCHKRIDMHISPPNSSLSVPNSCKETDGSARVVPESFSEIGRCLEQPIHHAVIDLNVVPQVPDDVETIHDMIHNTRCSSSLAESPSLVGAFQSHGSSIQETPQQVQQPPMPTQGQGQQQRTRPQDEEANMPGRRQSTRNRPLTTKALEAIESSLIETESKRKHTDSLTSRPSRRRRRSVGSNEMTTATITEDESPSKNPENAISIPHH